MKNPRLRRSVTASGVLAVCMLAGGILGYRPTMAQLGLRSDINKDHPTPVPSRVSIKTQGAYRYISGNGIPNHGVGAFPRRSNPNSITEQEYNFKMSLAPQPAPQFIPVGHSLEGVAINGVPFDPSTAAFWNNNRRSVWNYEAIYGAINLGLDQNHGHVQPTGAYHYHGWPTGLLTQLRYDQQMALVGYAADGFPIYGPFCPSNPNDLKSPLRKMSSSYRLRKGTRPTGEEGPGGVYDGTFTGDYEYVAGLGDLDEANGRTGPTPEYPDGTYYYVLSRNWPVISRLFKGTPDRSFLHAPPGNPRGNRPLNGRFGGEGPFGGGGPSGGGPPF